MRVDLVLLFLTLGDDWVIMHHRIITWDHMDLINMNIRSCLKTMLSGLWPKRLDLTADV